MNDDFFFSDYNSVIYDANCIIYYCFRTELHSRKGTLIVIDSPPFTNIIRNITQFLINRKIRIRTILVVFNEITTELLSLAIKQRINDDYLRKDLGLARGEKFPEDIEYNLNKKLKQKVKKMRYESWFELDEKYIPDHLLQNMLPRTLRNFTLRIFLINGFLIKKEKQRKVNCHTLI